jgi:hypothetical protein
MGAKQGDHKITTHIAQKHLRHDASQGITKVFPSLEEAHTLLKFKPTKCSLSFN